MRTFSFKEAASLLLLLLSCWFFTGVENAGAQEKQESELPVEARDSKAELRESKAGISAQRIIVVVGAGGEKEYGTQFNNWAERWQQLGDQRDDLEVVRIGDALQSPDENAPTDVQKLQESIESTPESVERLWVILIGHGTDDRQVSKFNLVGPDLTAKQLDQWLGKVTCPVVLVNCASASGGFVGKLQSPQRIVITATKSGAQYNFARFGNFFSQAVNDPSLDLDKDDQTSLLEAFIFASQKTQDFYEQEQRLATELALLDDNADGLGTPGDWYSGVRANRESDKAPVDGRQANRVILVRRGNERMWTAQQRQQRADLEAEIDTLRKQKETLEPDEYYRKLETLMLQMAQLYQTVTEATQEPVVDQAQDSE